MIKTILYLVSGISILCSCNSNQRNATPSSHALPSNVCNIDSTSNAFCLMNAKCFDTLSMEQIEKLRCDNLKYGEGVYVSNKYGTEFLFLRFNPGGMEKEFDTFVITDSIPAEFKNHHLHGKDVHFVTTNGAHIGMKIKD